MEYVLGFIAGILLAVLVGAVALYLLLRDKTPPTLPLVSLPATAPAPAAITILVTEQFLNQQLQQLFIADDGGGASNAPAIPQSFGPVKIKAKGAQLDLLPERHARLSIRTSATAFGFTVNLRPVAEFVLMPQTGRIRIVITRILLEGINIPRHWVDDYINAYVAGAEQQLNQSFQQLQTQTHVNLTDIETSGDVLIVKFS